MKQKLPKPWTKEADDFWAPIIRDFLNNRRSSYISTIDYSSDTLPDPDTERQFEEMVEAYARNIKPSLW